MRSIPLALVLLLARCRPSFCADRPDQDKTGIAAVVPKVWNANVSQPRAPKNASIVNSTKLVPGRADRDKEEVGRYALGFDFEKYHNDDDEDDEDEDDHKQKENPIPRVDVRCRYQRMTWLRKKKNMVTYQIFMAPHRLQFPDWCQNIQRIVLSQCLKSEAKSMLRPEDINWKRCDLDSTDKVDGWEGYTAAFDMPQWGDKFTEENEKANVNCILNAIQWAARGSIVHYFYDEKCYHIRRKKYRLDAH